MTTTACRCGCDTMEDAVPRQYTTTTEKEPEMATTSCGCGCGTATEQLCECGCDCCAPVAKTRQEEIEELIQVRADTDRRLAELEAR